MLFVCRQGKGRQVSGRAYCSAQALCFALLLAACGGGGDGGPSMSVSPTSITFTAVQNGATPASQNVSVSISGGTVVAQIKSITGTGFSVSLGIAGESTGIITVTPFAPTMAPGTYTGTITVRG